jgi:hypothetical protein
MTPLIIRVVQRVLIFTYKINIRLLLIVFSLVACLVSAVLDHPGAFLLAKLVFGAKHCSLSLLFFDVFKGLNDFCCLILRPFELPSPLSFVELLSLLCIKGDLLDKVSVIAVC